MKTGWIIGGVIAAVVVIVAVVLVLTLGGDDDGDESPNGTSQNQGPIGGQGPDVAPGPDSGGQGGGDGRPSKQEVTEGFSDMMYQEGISEEELAEAGMTREQIDSYITCIVDNIYDDVSIETQEALANRDPNVATNEQDMIVMGEATNQCVGELLYALRIHLLEG